MSGSYAGVTRKHQASLDEPFRRVKELLTELDILAGTVLVIRGDELLTSDSVVGDGDVVEVRPVMSGGSAGVIL